MEYVVVECNASRQVLVDGSACGNTNETLQIDKGTRTFRVPGCLPESTTVEVAGTSPATPLTLTFTC
jgi:hypothetical protein